jgi:hypothetical protein
MLRFGHMYHERVTARLLTVLCTVAVAGVAPVRADGVRAWDCMTRLAEPPHGEVTLDRIERLAGGSGGRCLAWRPASTQPDSAELSGTIRVEVPSALTGEWSVVPLPVGTWGYPRIGDVAQVILRKDSKGLFRAQTAVPVVLPASDAPLGRRGPSGELLQVFDFSRGPVGATGNRFGTFSGRGRQIRVHRRSRGDTWNLLVDSPDGPGYAGVWIELGAHTVFARNPQAGVDASGLDTVVIRGYGRPAGSVALHDVVSAAKDVPIPVGVLTSAEVHPDGSWSWSAPIPSAVDRSKLRTLIVDLTGSGADGVEIGDVWLTRGSRPLPLQQPFQSGPRRPVRRGLWVWNTAELLASDKARAKLLELLDAWRITEVFLQLPYDRREVPRWHRGEASKGLGVLVARLHSQNVRVHALDGASAFSTLAGSELLAAQGRRIVAFNRRWAPDGSFDAVHLDVEPYTLPAFGGRQRARLLRSYLRAITTVRSIVKPLPVWVDIPFWYDEPDEIDIGDRSPLRAGLLDEVVRRSDGIVVMSYRTAADGGNGVGAQALGEVQAAARAHRPVLLGFETVPLPPEDQWRVTIGSDGKADAGMPAVLLTRESAEAAPHLLFTESLAPADLTWIAEHSAEYRLVQVGYVAGADPSAVTNFGRSGADIEAVASESLQLLEAAGEKVDGVAFHESRTLPRP